MSFNVLLNKYNIWLFMKNDGLPLYVDWQYIIIYIITMYVNSWIYKKIYIGQLNKMKLQNTSRMSGLFLIFVLLFLLLFRFSHSFIQVFTIFNTILLMFTILSSLGKFPFFGLKILQKIYILECDLKRILFETKLIKESHITDKI